MENTTDIIKKKTLFKIDWRRLFQNLLGVHKKNSGKSKNFESKMREINQAQWIQRSRTVTFLSSAAIPAFKNREIITRTWNPHMRGEKTRNGDKIIARRRSLGLQGMMLTAWNGRNERLKGKGKILHLQVLTVWWRERKTKQALRRQEQGSIPFR